MPGKQSPLNLLKYKMLILSKFFCCFVSFVCELISFSFQTGPYLRKTRSSFLLNRCPFEKLFEKGKKNEHIIIRTLV